jgi:dipeptidyl aminopeptidase/acylaminoacyl peptidase
MKGSSLTIWFLSAVIVPFLPGCHFVENDASIELRTKQLLDEDLGGISVEAFFSNPEQTDFKLSPDGTQIAWLAPWQDRMNLYVRSLEIDMEPIRLTSDSTADIGRYFWVNNHNILYLKDANGKEAYHLYGVEVTTQQMRDLTPFEGVNVEIIDELSAFPDELIVSMNKNNPRLSEPFRLNLESGKLTQLAQNRNLREPLTWWVADHKGQLRVAFSVTDGVRNNVLYRSNENEPFHKVLTTDWTEYMQPLFFDFDNNTVYAASNLNRDKTAIVRYDLEQNKELEVVYEHPEVDVYDLGYSRNRKLLTWAGFANEKWQMVWLDSAAARFMQRIESELGQDVEIRVNSIDDYENRFVIRTYSDRSLGSWYLYDYQTDLLTKLADVNDQIDVEQMAEMRPISFAARDGMPIHGYLTLPPGRDTKNLPVIVNPHGGPRTRNYWGFNSEVQLLANRGYAVLQINYRGSTGYGRAFANAGFKEWGGAIQRDISDGVDWLIAEGIADPDQVGIYGFSFGGYCALSGLVTEPNRYACGASYGGLTDLFAFVDSLPPIWEPYRAMILTMVGDPDKDSLMMDRASPGRHPDQIIAPLFISHGAKDTRVHVQHARDLANKLDRQGKAVFYLERPEEGHQFTSEESRQLFYKSLVGFFARYMPGAPVSYSKEKG